MTHKGFSNEDTYNAIKSIPMAVHFGVLHSDYTVDSLIEWLERFTTINIDRVNWNELRSTIIFN